MKKDQANVSRYETPVVVELGELAEGVGLNCESGSTAQGHCDAGGDAHATRVCSTGHVVSTTCSSGPQVPG